MNRTENIPLADTSREELSERIGQARERFYGLIRTADPLARPRGSAWTVQQYVAHVLSVALHYRDIIHGREYLRAATTAEVHLHNQAEMEALVAPVPELADQIQAVEKEMDGYFDAHTDDQRVLPFHGGVMVSGITGQTNWLGELVMHGHDIARAVKSPYRIDERDMLLVARGMMDYGHGFLRADVSPDTDVCVALKVPDARPYVIHVHDGIAEFRLRRPADRPDAVLRTPASTLTEMLYERIGPFTAVRRGLFIVGGRRPWTALKLQSFFAS
jgi:uncharacterized damage-inducible protein DinB